MSHEPPVELTVELSDPEALEQCRVALTWLLEWEGRLTDDLRVYLGRKAAGAGLHRLDLERLLAEIEPLLAVPLGAHQRGDEPVLGSLQVNPVDGAKMVWLPPGTVVIGSEDCYELPVHPVTLTQGFWLYETPVTNAMYARFLEANPQQAQPASWRTRSFSDEFPILAVV